MSHPWGDDEQGNSWASRIASGQFFKKWSRTKFWLPIAMFDHFSTKFVPKTCFLLEIIIKFNFFLNSVLEIHKFGIRSVRPKAQPSDPNTAPQQWPSLASAVQEKVFNFKLIFQIKFYEQIWLDFHNFGQKSNIDGLFYLNIFFEKKIKVQVRSGGNTPASGNNASQPGQFPFPGFHGAGAPPAGRRQIYKIWKFRQKLKIPYKNVQISSKFDHNREISSKFHTKSWCWIRSAAVAATSFSAGQSGASTQLVDEKFDVFLFFDAKMIEIASTFMILTKNHWMLMWFCCPKST